MRGMRVLIVGAGGHGKVVLDILRAADLYEPAGFIDADPALAGTSSGGIKVLGAMNLLPKLHRQGIKAAIVAIGDARARRHCAALLRELGIELVNAVHPTAFVSPTAVLGQGVVVAAQAAVSTESRVDDLAIINTSAVVDHECHIGEAAHVCPGAHLAGRVSVGRDSFIGLGANVIQCLKIGEGATVGAGAVVREDVPAFSTVVGVPARVIRAGQEPSRRVEALEPVESVNPAQGTRQEDFSVKPERP
jgi:sugar O-acyltransferase (sialic acid O-acetyltransferase NeuD family)